MITFKQLEAIYWIANLGSFAAAADKLCTSQSAVSKRVQELETALAAKDALERGTLLSASGIDLAPIRELGLLTAKPFIFVFNVDESVLTDAGAKANLAAQHKQLCTRVRRHKLLGQLDL